MHSDIIFGSDTVLDQLFSQRRGPAVLAIPPIARASSGARIAISISIYLPFL